MLDAMAAAVAEKGYAATTVADVIKRAGVSRKTFYEQFHDKEDCFLQAYDVILGMCLQRVADAYMGHEEWSERLRHGLDAFLRFLASEPAFARLCVVEALAAGPQGVARRDQALAAFASFLDVARNEAPSGNAPPPLIAEVTTGGIYGLIYTRIVRGETESLPELLPDMMYVALVPFVGQEEALAASRRAGTTTTLPTGAFAWEQIRS
jgi:AcrR family transcriptional regulator